MKDPVHVSKLVRAMHEGVNGELPVTVKCRIGLHDQSGIPFARESYDKLDEEREYTKLCKFIETIASDGIVDTFLIHTRIAVLGGDLSAADNRKIPPLKYDYVRRLTLDFPQLNFVLNGGVHSLAQVQDELSICGDLAGVMVGRAMVADPWGFAMADECLYRANDEEKPICSNRRELLQAYGRHVDHEEQHNDPALIRRQLVAPCAHLFAGEANSLQFRIDLDEIAGRPERLEREAKSNVWSNAMGNRDNKSSLLASAFSSSASQSMKWDDFQALDDARPSWDENEPPLSELILEAAQRNFGDDLLDLNRSESYARKLNADARGDRNSIVLLDRDDNNPKRVSGGVVDGWFNNGLN